MNLKDFENLTTRDMEDHLITLSAQCVDGAPVSLARNLGAYFARIRQAENDAVARLEALNGYAGEEGHGEADDILLQFAPPRVRELYENLGSMWYS